MGGQETESDSPQNEPGVFVLQRDPVIEFPNSAGRLHGLLQLFQDTSNANTPYIEKAASLGGAQTQTGNSRRGFATSSWRSYLVHTLNA